MTNSTPQDTGKIGFVGAGNMAQSLIGGLIDQGIASTRIVAADPYAPSRDSVQRQFHIETSDDNVAIANQVDTLVLAIKPQQMHTVCQQIKPAVQQRKPLLISVAAGITTELFGRWLGTDQSIVRVMPNTPALIGAGATGLFAGAAVSAEQQQQAQSIMQAVGSAHWVEQEAHIDVVTALSGSGPAYFFLLIEALSDAATEAGLDAATARELAEQTAFGAASLVRAKQIDAATLRQQVTSPNGTTERAIGVLEDGDLRGLMRQAIKAAITRSQQMGLEQSELVESEQDQ